MLRPGRALAVSHSACSPRRVLLAPDLHDRSWLPRQSPMGRSWLGLLLAGALGILLGSGLTAHLLTAPRVSSLVEGHSLATIDELGARLTTQENLQVGKPSIEHGADVKKGTEPAEEEEEEEKEEEEKEEEEKEEE